MTLKIAQLGQPVLRQRAVEIPPDEILTQPFQDFLDHMVATLEKEEGVGLAAPQVFSPRRVFIACVIPSEIEDDPPDVEVFINPQFLEMSEEKTLAWEGCLSFPELLVKVPRSRRVRISYIDGNGLPQVLDLSDFPARVVQHEYDHLEGILTLDRAPSSLAIVKASEIKTVTEAEKKASELGERGASAP